MKRLHPSVEEFKKFVNHNPKVLEEVRNGKATLQELFEDWYLLGEDDTRWNAFRSAPQPSNSSAETKTEWMANIFDKLKNMDSNQIQSQIGQLSQALGAIQGIVAQFQNESRPKMMNESSQKPNHPFLFRKD